jgi:hypothetical protein
MRKYFLVFYSFQNSRFRTGKICKVVFPRAFMGTFKEIEIAFAPITDAILTFAHRKSFQLDQCVRGNAGWELTQPHTLGGTVTLLLLYEPSWGLGIGSVWQYPCSEMSLLYSHFRKMRSCPLNSEAVTSMLDEESHEIMQVPFGYWTHISPLQASS